MLLVALPLAGLLSKIPWPGLWQLLTSESSLAALQLSILTASVSTAKWTAAAVAPTRRKKPPCLAVRAGGMVFFRLIR